MNTVVIGASNSIIGEKGYVLALRGLHSVTNLSGADIPVLFTISKLLQAREVIANADWVILDHSISDRAVYFPRLGEEYMHHIDEVYQAVAMINRNILCLGFPMLRNTANDKMYIDGLAKICRKHGAVFVDFQGVISDPRCFEDPLHAHCEISYLIGEFLSEFIPNLERATNFSGDDPFPFHRLDASETSADAPVHRFSSRLAQATYVEINTPLEVSFEEIQRLVFIEYVVLRNEPRYLALTINGTSNFFGGLDISGEIIRQLPSKHLSLAPVTDDGALPMTHSTKATVAGPFAPMNLVSMVFRKEGVPFPELPPHPVKVRQIDFAPLHVAIAALQSSSWFDDVQHMSEASSQLIEALNSKGLKRHKEYFGPTFDSGAKIRSARIQRYLEDFVV